MNGRCTCGRLRYRLTSTPLYTYCCHCRWCQRETGAAFALNAMIEADPVELLQGHPEAVTIPTQSGQGQTVMRCPTCREALWSHDAGAGRKASFVRVGTLDDPDTLPPDIGIFTESRQPWTVLPVGAAISLRYYQRDDHWPPDSLARWRTPHDPV